MGLAHSKNGVINEEDKKALRRANFEASTASSDGNWHQARAEDVLSKLEQAALLAHVPNLQEAANLAISLLDVIPSLRGNKSVFRSLAADGCGLLYVVICSCEGCDQEGRVLPQYLIHCLSVLLGKIKEAVDVGASRGVVSSFLFRGDDAKRIQECKEEARRYLHIFGLQSHSTVREALYRIQRRQGAILEALEARTASSQGGKTPLDLSTSAAATSTHATTGPSTPPAAWTSYGNIVNNGEATFNSVDGNYVVDNSTTNASSINSGNIMNKSTINSNNAVHSRRANRSMGSGTVPGGPPRGYFRTKGKKA
ncbi:hypothetical protein BDN71DRAFT_1446869 [Pleurotus eryngii]|uniref:Uncharacterized protein n=1 Tax=Pleurotus eryngii TaxID=5323 RepID=A0A9P5ZXS1_PLEER|nr:hypothetical protein BDN71DRAFT_1446869 [Pleurotus eryngii]